MRKENPIGMAAVSLYIAFLQHNEKTIQKDITEASGVTEITVRNRNNALKKQLNLEVPDKKPVSISAFFIKES